ncbi:putative beta-glucosidase A [Lasiodiplodia theobromae]|uniref:Putative beta-glucosidase A n=1 Tax=Lasiodiplodia theobromae TaxID=45133 RepID=A0A5N5D5B8_9PEZI|nr:putative beta-glucosidase A [Lasiodiplodia theobromae]
MEEIELGELPRPPLAADDALPRYESPTPAPQQFQPRRCSLGATSPPFYPSPWMDGSGGWAEAYAKAQEFFKQMTLLEKVNLTTGIG